MESYNIGMNWQGLVEVGLVKEKVSLRIKVKMSGGCYL
jgi:hypothetical protein